MTFCSEVIRQIKPYLDKDARYLWLNKGRSWGPVYKFECAKTFSGSIRNSVYGARPMRLKRVIC